MHPRPAPPASSHLTPALREPNYHEHGAWTAPLATPSTTAHRPQPIIPRRGPAFLDHDGSDQDDQNGIGRRRSLTTPFQAQVLRAFISIVSSLFSYPSCPYAASLLRVDSVPCNSLAGRGWASHRPEWAPSPGTHGRRLLEAHNRLTLRLGLVSGPRNSVRPSSLRLTRSYRTSARRLASSFLPSISTTRCSR